jgi:hypothetical protein
MTTQTNQNQKKDNRKRVAAVALVGLGIAGLATASASQLDVGAQDRVASGVATDVEGLTGAVATLSTARADDSAPVAGAVPVDLTVDVTTPDGWAGNLADWEGTLYIGEDPNGIAFDPAGTATISDRLTSHVELDTVSVVLVNTSAT